MLPPIILMHRVTSSHSESHSSNTIELPNKEFLRIFPRNHCFIIYFLFSLQGPLQGPPYGAPRAPIGGGPQGLPCLYESCPKSVLSACPPVPRLAWSASAGSASGLAGFS